MLVPLVESLPSAENARGLRTWDRDLSQDVLICATQEGTRGLSRNVAEVDGYAGRSPLSDGQTSGLARESGRLWKVSAAHTESFTDKIAFEARLKVLGLSFIQVNIVQIAS